MKNKEKGSLNFETWARQHIEQHPGDWPLLDGHDDEEKWARLAWAAREGAGPALTFEIWAKQHINQHPGDWPLLDGHDDEETWARLAWNARAELEGHLSKSKEGLAVESMDSFSVLKFKI